LPNRPEPDTAAPLSSVHTANFSELLRRARCSLLATTFQANKLILVRPQSASLNTHFYEVARPMGLAADRNRIFVGSQHAVQEFRNVPALAAKLEPAHLHDAVYLPRNTHITGHVDIHEIAFAEQQCWYVDWRCRAIGRNSSPHWARPTCAKAGAPTSAMAAC
jgi:uncharacterized protein (TIGR03032 family)